MLTRENKTTMRYHFTFIRMAIIKETKTQEITCRQDTEKKKKKNNNTVYCWGNVN